MANATVAEWYKEHGRHAVYAKGQHLRVPKFENPITSKVEGGTIKLSYDYEEHFRLDPIEERLHQFRASIDVRATKKVTLNALVGVDIWNNQDQIRGRSDTGLVAMVGATWDY